MKAGKTLVASIFLIILSIGILNSKTFEGSRMFTKEIQSYKGNILKTNQIASRNEIVATFNLQKQYIDNALLNCNKNIVITGFPINPSEFDDILLEPAPAIVDANTIFISKSGNDEIRFKGPMVLSYKGQIKNKPDSKVFLSYCGGFLTGYIESGDGYKYDITTAKDAFLSGKYIVNIAEQNVPILNSQFAEAFKCYTDENAFGNSNYNYDLKKMNDNPQADKPGLLECKVSLEGAYDYFDLMGKDSIVAAQYMISVMAHVSKIYEEYLNVRIVVPYIIIYTTAAADPYAKANITNFAQKLYTMPKIWKTLPQNSALMCMFTSLRASSSDGSYTAGISFGGDPGVGSLCNAIGKRSYSVFGITSEGKYPNYSYTWDVNVAAHEIGHNFGAPHTHSCYYSPNMIDTCVTKSKPMPVGDACLDGEPKPVLGTIMSYCHTSNSTHSVDLSFHPRQIASMRKAAELAFCIPQLTNPFISLLSPLAENYFIVGKTVKIRWTSSKISNVAIKYSSNNGAEWNIITGSTPSNDTVYEWITPDIHSTDCLIIIADATNPLIADTTKVKFSIIRPMIAVTEPTEGRHYGKREIMRINWESTVSKKFNIDYNIEGSSKWEMIAAEILGNSFNWDIPDVVSNNCRIKITDAENLSLVAISPVFGINDEVLKLSAPVQNEEICAKSNYKVEWKSDYVNLIYLRYSLDGGETWKKNFAPLDATLGYYTWVVPDANSDNVKLRIVMKDDQNVVLDETQYSFKIKPCEPNSVIENNSAGFRLLSILPNPVGSRALVKYECNDANTGTIELYVVNLLGQVVINPSKLNIDCGTGSFSYDFGSLPHGSYMLMARVNGKVTGMMVVVE
jgi:hypothetical protein